MSDTVISLEGIKKSYGKHQVLSGVDLEINRGDIYGLVGRNGAGKTTIFKIILGLSDYQGGKLSIGDAEDASAGRQKIGFFVGKNFFPYLTGRQNLEYYRVLKGIKDKHVVEDVLKIVGLDQAKGAYKGYSMGMQQRLGIANALLGQPEILILDEPVNGLDPQGIADIRKLLQTLNETHGITVIVSSHILGELQHTAHRFGIVNNGVIAKVVTQEDLQVQANAVRISVDHVERARAVLGEAGIQILGEENETLSLEDYYFSLVGGNES